MARSVHGRAPPHRAARRNLRPDRAHREHRGAGHAVEEHHRHRRGRAVDRRRALGELDALYALGYDNRGFFAGAGDHLFFRRVVAGKRTHHLHVVTIDSAELESWLAFRECLRTDATAAAEYAAAKRDLFARFPGDRMGYMEAKSLVVSDLITRMQHSTS